MNDLTQFSPALLGRISAGEIAPAQVEEYRQFLDEVQAKFMSHHIITDNEYCQWFEQGDISLDHVRHFVVQFSVFSNLFLIAQLKKMINSQTLEAMHASKEILANEIGAIFRRRSNGAGAASASSMTEAEKELSGDPELVNTEGTVDGGMFKFKAAHFEWLLRLGKTLDLEFDQMGKRRHGTESTLFFCDELSRIYGGEDPSEAEGASFAVENWAAAGFWKQLVRGLQAVKAKDLSNMPLAFFTWHDKVEDQHASYTQDELEQVFFTDWFDRGKFISGGLEMLEGVAAFWMGLDRDRQAAQIA
ncbi:MAG: hypothetical protein IID15_05865 [Candidatus Marinimicrobia bacterium]|nr:hypothetical protein [Candidatus Neomarinimicrobiota bacterium]